MGTQLGASPFQEPTSSSEQDIISSWLDLDDVFFQQELQDLEHHLLNLDQTDPISSSALPIPEGSSPFMLDDLLQSNIQNHHHQQPILPVEQCVDEPDIRDTFLNDYEFGLVSPTDDLSPDINEVQFCETTISSEPVITTAHDDESNKTDDEEGTDEDRPKQVTLISKNMVSERNRRKRLSKQLLSLRALVPNITKMDKRSVLVDALSYLRNIHDETELLQKEIKEHLTGRPKLNDLRESSEDNASESLGIPCTKSTSAAVAVTKPKAQITEIDIEKIEDKRFIVKITCKGGVGSDVLRVFESLDFEITYAALQQLQPQQVLATIYVRARKQWKMTEEKLKHSITTMALKTGLSLPNP
ncbi:Transcription factor bhlh [Thalictrum thalictroides]|uniref:Transcription factor bhlh n=1 Tax=Thalictrum thalictroides TaxID=46969 RepID=A0A7J6W6T0_THATH|nr:Transcription factor bhlh [Thalictrum thalictroides]